jgi:hypothetical protein
MNMYTIVHFGLFTNQMLPYKCSNLHTYLSSADYFLCLLPGTPTLSLNGCALNINKDSFRIFAELRGKEKQLEVHSAVRALVAARKKGRKNICGLGAASGGAASGSDGDY